MELSLIRKLARLMTSTELSELEIDDQESGLHVRMKRGAEVAPNQAPIVHLSQPAPMPGPVASAVPAAAGAPAAPPAGRELPPGAVPFLSPMVGTFYRASSPDSDPFVEIGTSVDEDSVLCIVEAMKVMNEIKAETQGKVLEILAENGDPIEYGQPLFLIQRG